MRLPSEFDGFYTGMCVSACSSLGLLSAIVGVGSLMVGCSIMVRETRLAIRNLAEEVELAALPVEVP